MMWVRQCRIGVTGFDAAIYVNWARRVRGARVLVEDAHLGRLVLPRRQHPDFPEPQMLAHFVAEMLGLRGSARPRREPYVRRELYHETLKGTKGSKAAGAFQQSRCPMGTQKIHRLGRPVDTDEGRECPHQDGGHTRRKPIVPPRRRRGIDLRGNPGRQDYYYQREADPSP